jgi:nucleoid DNA-binding protein
LIDQGVDASEIGIFVRSENEIQRARAVVTVSGQAALELSERVEEPGGRVSIGIMHLAKGLEFKAVAVMACDDDALPLQERVETVADEAELDEVYETERHLFYVACTRADLVIAIHAETGLAQSDCADLLRSVLGCMVDNLVDGNPIKINGFAGFSVRHKPERIGRNPKTSVEAPISARNVVVFKPAQALKDKVDQAENQ